MKIYLQLLLIALVCGCNSSVNPERSNSDGRFSDDQSILDTAWDLRKFTGSDGSIRTVASITKYQIRLISDSGILESFRGCSSAVGWYEINDGVLVFSLGEKDDNTCITDREYLEQTVQIMDIIGRVPSTSGGTESLPLMISRQNNTLKLTAADGRKLEFESVLELDEFQRCPDENDVDLLAEEFACI